MITINNVEIQMKDGVRGGEKGEGETVGYKSGTGRGGIIPSRPDRSTRPKKYLKTFGTKCSEYRIVLKLDLTLI